MPLIRSSAGHAIDLIDFDVQVEIFAQLFDLQPVSLQIFNNFRQPPRQQIGERTRDRERWLRAAEILGLVISRLAGGDASAAPLFLDKAQHSRRRALWS